MADKTKDELQRDHNNDGINRRGFLKCTAWAGTGVLCVMQGGVLKILQHEPDFEDWRTSGHGRTELRADQRQPYGIQQGSESGCCGHAESSGGQN